MLFRKSFNVYGLNAKGGGAKRILKISADTRYFLYINGETAVLDGSLLRDAYCENSGFADGVDIAPYLLSGKNQMEILVWHYGNGGRNNNPLECAGLVFECPELDLYSDSRTLCARHPAYGETGEPYPSYLYGGYNIGYDANKEIKGRDFVAATEYGAEQFGEIFERPIPLFRFSNVIISPYERTGDKYTVTLPAALHIMPWFRVDAAGGERIDIRTDRYTVNGGPGDHYGRYNGHRAEYICKPGVNEFQNLDWFAAEQIIFTIPDGVKVQQLGYRISEYDTEFPGVLITGDRQADILMQKCARTLKFCMRDNFMDCPDRERGQWIGDVSVQAPQVFFALGRKAVPLLKKAIMNFICLRKGDRLVGNVPGIHYQELPAQSLNAISEIGMIAQYYKYTGDKEILRLAFAPSVKYLQLWEIDGGGLVSKRAGDWYWFDHLNNNDERVMENAWYYSALKFALYTAGEINDHSRDSFLNGRINSIKDNFDKAFWKGNRYASSVFTDERANALAVLAGLASADKHTYIRDVLISTFNCTAYMEGYVCEALCVMGYNELAYRRLMSRYYNLIQNENGTLWEDFFILGTRNHAWTGAPLTLFYKYFAGINTTDHMKTITVKPDFSILKRYKFALDVGGKKLSVDARLDKDGKAAIKINNKTAAKVFAV